VTLRPPSPLRHEFVTAIPRTPEAGVLYVSVPYATTMHLCPCGCGQEVPLPLTPTDWCLTFDGETVSLWPSVGSWSLPCQSHYWIRRGRVFWAKPWSAEQIERNRRKDRERKARELGK